MCKSLLKKNKKDLTKKSTYDKMSKLLATKTVAKQKRKKFLTIKTDCARLKKLLRSKKCTTKNKIKKLLTNAKRYDKISKLL